MIAQCRLSDYRRYLAARAPVGEGLSPPDSAVRPCRREGLICGNLIQPQWGRSWPEYAESGHMDAQARKPAVQSSGAQPSGVLGFMQR